MEALSKTQQNTPILLGFFGYPLPSTQVWKRVGSSSESAPVPPLNGCGLSGGFHGLATGFSPLWPQEH